MKIDVTQNLLGLNGEPMPIVFQTCPMCGRGIEDKGLRTLRNTGTAALSEDYQDEQRSGGVSSDEKFRRYCLAMKIHNNDEPNLTAEEIVLLLKVTSKMFPPRIYGPVRLILEPGESEADKG